MKHRFTALATLAIPITALLAACGSSGHDEGVQRASALAAPVLGTLVSFAVLGGETVTNTGATTVAGDLGVQPGTAVTGFPPGIQTAGAMHKADAVSLQAQSDLTTAYDELAGDPCTLDLSGTDLGGLSLTEGVYCFSSEAQLTGTLTLDAQGKADAVFIFKVGSKLTTASNSSVSMLNGASGCRVFWQIGSSATVGTNTAFVGNILALTSISLQTGASVDGRALARNGEVTMDYNHIAISACTVPDAGPGDAGAVDSGAEDSGGGSNDTGASDAGASDAGASDAGASDAGASDAGASDAGANDSGGNGGDTGVPDTGPVDSGGGDSGSTPDTAWWCQDQEGDCL